MITVEDLIEKLQELPGDAVVMLFGVGYRGPLREDEALYIHDDGGRVELHIDDGLATPPENRSPLFPRNYT